MGTLSLAAHLVLSVKSRLWASTGFHLLPSFHNHPTQHNNTTQTVTLTVTLTSTFSLTLYRYSSPRNVVCPSGAWFENRPYLTPSVYLAWNPKHVIVQWVGIGTHTHCGNAVKKAKWSLWLRNVQVVALRVQRRARCLSMLPFVRNFKLK